MDDGEVSRQAGVGVTQAGTPGKGKEGPSNKSSNRQEVKIRHDKESDEVQVDLTSI